MFMAMATQPLIYGLAAHGIMYSRGEGAILAERIKYGSYAVLWTFFVAFYGTWFCIMGFLVVASALPETGISVANLDQASTLVGGCIQFGVTIVGILRYHFP